MYFFNKKKWRQKKLVRIDNSEYSNIINEYKTFLFEERGISKEVQNEAKYLTSLINQEINKIKVSFDKNNFLNKNYSYEYNIFNFDISLHISYYFF